MFDRVNHAFMHLSSDARYDATQELTPFIRPTLEHRARERTISAGLPAGVVESLILGKKIRAIKLMRESYRYEGEFFSIGIGLKCAKELVEEFGKDVPVLTDSPEALAGMIAHHLLVVEAARKLLNNNTLANASYLAETIDSVFP